MEVLKKRYGKETAIQRAHVNDLLNLPHVFNDKDTRRLRQWCDSCETHFRGLKALSEIETHTRQWLCRPTAQIGWGLWTDDHAGHGFHKLVHGGIADRLFEQSGAERRPWPRGDCECWISGPETRCIPEQGEQNERNLDLPTRQETDNCAFCLGKHAHEHCPKVVDVNKRKDILYKFAKCLKSLRKGHRVWECAIIVVEITRRFCGYVHTKPDKFQNATFFIRIGLPSTLKRCFRCPKTELFWKRSPKWINLKTPAKCVSVDRENGTFWKRWRHNSHVTLGTRLSGQRSGAEATFQCGQRNSLKTINVDGEHFIRFRGKSCVS